MLNENYLIILYDEQLKYTNGMKKRFLRENIMIKRCFKFTPSSIIFNVDTFNKTLF